MSLTGGSVTPVETQPAAGTSGPPSLASQTDAPGSSSLYAPWDDALDEGDGSYYPPYNASNDACEEYTGPGSFSA